VQVIAGWWSQLLLAGKKSEGYDFWGPEEVKMDVSKNSGTPKWMVYNGTPYQKGMIWVYPYFLETPR